MRTGFIGWWPGCPSRQTARAAATSGRACSAACAVFFALQPPRPEIVIDRRTADQNALAQQAKPQLVERDVALRGQQPIDQICVRRQDMDLTAAGPARRNRARRPPALHQLDHEADAHRIFERNRRSEEHTSELQSLMRISYAV